MDKTTLITGVKVINEGKVFEGGVAFSNGFITRIYQGSAPPAELLQEPADVIDAKGHYLLPGAIDDQVHFREPGLTHKANIYTESRAAVAGGITSYMEMPNTVPNTVTQDLLQEKYDLAAERSLANFSFYLGATNDNLQEVLKTDPARVCGVKVFMGSSTGNMLVDDRKTLEGLFAECPALLAAHCEDEATIKRNLVVFKEKYGEAIPPSAHALIRSEEACYKSSSVAIELASKYGSRFHLLHVSTARELELLDKDTPLADKKITAEACIHHLWFTDRDYISKGNFIKWNPAVKTEKDRHALRQAVLENRIDVIATDHAPHSLEEKRQNYLKAPSGGPMVQHALLAMLELNHQGVFPLTAIAEKMCHAPAIAYRIKKRGFIREGYHADLVLVNLEKGTEVDRGNLHYKCGWSPFEGQAFNASIVKTFVNGNLVFDEGLFFEDRKGERLLFESQ